GAVRGIRGLGGAFGFLVAGTTYYLPWTGPEALTASAVLVGALAGMRGETGIALLATGVATAQNPGALALTAFVGGWWLLLKRYLGATGLPDAKLAALDRRAVVLALGGGCLAA